ncbi:MAG: hypothetical protein PHU12_02315 [Candidatus Aenigmarchaeota archaeon]|nr:hypothetical protein [Candidatus Aenigmarchaeota archaeon]
MEEEKKKLFKIPKLKKWDKIALVGLIIFIILMAIPVYRSKGDCEVARPEYKCESAKNVMIEHCTYWAQYQCDTSADISLPQVEWYIKNLCEIYNQNHNAGLNCNNLKLACNVISGQSLCPVS